MKIDPVAQMLDVRAAGTQQSLEMAIMRKAHEMDMAVVNMVEQQARAAPPPGQGTKVDKLA